MKTNETYFALIASNGDILFPYQKDQRQTGRFGYAISKPGDGDRNGGAEYTLHIEDVIKRVVLDGWKVRAKTRKGITPEREGSFKIGKRTITGYWVAPQFSHLVSGAETAPSPLSEAALSAGTVNACSS